MAKLLPRLQLALMVIFGVISLFGPMLVSQGHLVILTAALAGVLLGVVTFLIGWRLEVTRESVIYPFAGWSRGILKLFAKPTQRGSFIPASKEFSPLAREAIGIFSLAAGPLLVIVLIIVVVLVLSA